MAAYLLSPANPSCSIRCFPTTYRRLHKRPSSVGVQNSGDQAVASEQDSIESVEAPKGPPSLVSTLNVDKILRGIAITDVDHYGRLGLQTGCSYEDVSVAYKNKVADVANKGLSDEEVSKELDMLQESHGILSSIEERRMYDWSLARIGKPDRYVWPFEVDITQTPTGTPPPREPEDEGPTRLVGYFMLSWLLLSFALFVIFNR